MATADKYREELAGVTVTNAVEPYICAACRDTGWVPTTDYLGRPAVRRCEECAPQRTVPGLPERYAAASWQTWQHVQEVAEVVGMLREWRGGEGAWCIVLYAAGRANVGAGKTRALATVCREWRLRGERVTYTTMARVMINEGLRMDGMTSGLGGVEWACEYQGLLALDDLGQEHDDKRGWAAGAVETIVDARYAALRPTIIATNFDLSALRTNYPRAFSRFHEGELCPWVAPDFRRR